jgi:hypothetical protein
MRSGGGDDAEDVAVGRVGEEELVRAVEYRHALFVHLLVGSQQVYANCMFQRRLVGPPEWVWSGESECIYAFAQFSRERK